MEFAKIERGINFGRCCLTKSKISRKCNKIKYLVIVLRFLSAHISANYRLSFAHITSSHGLVNVVLNYVIVEFQVVIVECWCSGVLRLSDVLHRAPLCSNRRVREDVAYERPQDKISA